MPEIEIEDRFTLLPAPSGEEDHWEYGETLSVPTNRVWTVVEGDGDECSQWCTHGDSVEPDRREPYEYGHRPEFYALPGYHLVNRLYYYVTAEEWSDDDTSITYIA